jgi:hypothetical protein
MRGFHRPKVGYVCSEGILKALLKSFTFPIYLSTFLSVSLNHFWFQPSAHSDNLADETAHRHITPRRPMV